MIWWAGGTYLGTALVGVWAAPDRQLAWGRFALIAVSMAVAIGIAQYGARGGEHAAGVTSLATALVAAGLSTHFVLTSDWTEHGPAKVVMLQEVGAWMQALRPVELPGRIHENAVGGALAILAPLTFASVGWAWRCRHRVAALLAGLSLLLTLATLALTMSRGACLGLAAGTLLAGALCLWPHATSASTCGGRGIRFRPDAAILGALVLLPLASYWIVLTLPAFVDLARDWGGSAGASLVSRIQLWRNVSAMIRDYAFTGSGLGVTEMQYSSYVLLLHVPYLSHAHNLYLQTAIEQGVSGLAAFVGLTWIGLRRVTGGQANGTNGLRFRAAAFAAMVTLLVHGLFDSQLYTSELVPVMFLPFGAALALPPRTPGYGTHRDIVAVSRAWRSALVPSLAALMAVIILSSPGLQAALQANLGAVAQSRAEISAYHWPEWPIQDATRRSTSVDLSPAITRFRAALALDPANVTANRRLGQIELSLGHYEAARRHLEAAYETAPDERATRQLLGESYAVAGDPERAAALWRTIDVQQGQLDLRRGWYALLGDRERMARVVSAMILSERGSGQPPA